MAGKLVTRRRRVATAVTTAQLKIDNKLIKQGRGQFSDKTWRQVTRIVSKIKRPMTPEAEANALIELTAVFDIALKEIV